MSENINYYRDNDLIVQQLNSNYTLLLQIYSTSFSYAVVYQHRLLAWAENCDLDLLNEPGNEHDLLSFDYKNIVVGVPSTGFTLIPDTLYNPDKIADLARFLDVKPNEKVFAQQLDDHNHIIYKVDEAVIATAQIFGLQKVVYIAKGWINAIAESKPAANDLYLDIDKSQASVLYFSAGKIRFYNTFEFNNPDELAYYAVFVAQELKLKTEDINLILSGDITIGDKNASRLAEFFNGVEPDHLQVLDLPDSIPSHQILALAALSSCVSSEVL
jgi:hypothetical protein